MDRPTEGRSVASRGLDRNAVPLDHDRGRKLLPQTAKVRQSPAEVPPDTRCAFFDVRN